MREQPTPCVHASRAQFLCGLHRTFNDDRVCDGCRDIAARAAARLAARREGPVLCPTGTGPTSTEVPPGPLGERGTRPLVGGPGPARSPGEQFQAFPSRGTGSLAGRAAHQPFEWSPLRAALEALSHI